MALPIDNLEDLKHARPNRRIASKLTDWFKLMEQWSCQSSGQQMSVPSVFATGSHLGNQLTLSGQRVALVESLNIRSLSQPVRNGYQHESVLNRIDVLPSITPSSRNSSAKSLLRNKGTSSTAWHNFEVNLPKSQSNSNVKSYTPREANIICTDGGNLVTKELLRFSSAPEHKHGVCDEDYVTESGDSCDEHHDVNRNTVKEFLTEKQHEQLVTLNLIETEKSLPPSRKKRKKKKKRPKSKYHQRDSTQRKDSRVENVYNDTSVLRKSAELNQLQAYCCPIQAAVAPQKPKKAMIDYSQYATSKAPSVPKALRSNDNEKPNIAERTKEYMSSLSSKQLVEPPHYVKDNREVIKKYHDQQNSVYGAKLSASKQPSTITISASSECFTFRPPVPKPMHHSVLRKSLGSAPGNNGMTEQRVFKIFQSDRQSANVEDMGVEFPGPPPASPVPEMWKNIEFVLSMSDIRSQRALKLRLESLQKIEKQKKERIKEEKARIEKLNQKERLKEMRRQQRREIYVLNKKMTDFELSNFRDFCDKNGIACTE